MLEGPRSVRSSPVGRIQSHRSSPHCALAPGQDAGYIRLVRQALEVALLTIVHGPAPRQASALLHRSLALGL